ncbi:MAG: hypothetical protein IT371_10785 [Deltaproteobacteria bacterium]|nr:hypothetical protein [Deltaproteobacteria bacterium]
MKLLLCALSVCLVPLGCAPVKDRSQLDKGVSYRDRGVYADWGSGSWDVGSGWLDSGASHDGQPRSDGGRRDKGTTGDKGTTADKGASTGCSAADSECATASWPPAACTGGKCFAKGCCCPTERQCSSGSFPVCCPPGKTCKGGGNCG